MEAIYEWVRQMIGCLLLLSLLIQLLPSAEYEKYIRLFAGMILILLTLSPLMGGRRVQEEWVRSYEAWSEEKDSAKMEEITRKMQEADRKREELIEEELKKETLNNEEQQAESSAAERIQIPRIEISGREAWEKEMGGERQP